MESSFRLDNLPLELLVTIVSELPARQIIDICQLSRYLNTVNHDWKFWQDKACRDFNYPRIIFDQTSIELPVQRYYQITQYYGPKKEAVLMAIRHDNVADLEYLLDRSRSRSRYWRWLVTAGYLQFYLSEVLSRGHLPIIRCVLEQIIAYFYSYWHYLPELNKRRQQHHLRFLNSCLIQAAKYSHVQTIDYLIQLGATKIFPAFHVAARQQQLPIMTYLLQQPNFRYEVAIDALNLAAKHQCWQTIEFLLNQYVNDNQALTRLMEVAATASNLDLIRYLLRHHVVIDLNVGLHVAATRGDLNLVKFLCENGAHDITGALNAIWCKKIPGFNHGNRQSRVEQYLTLQLDSSRR
jgi:ankyrin repeat protein